MVLRCHSSCAKQILTDLPLHHKDLCNINHGSGCHSDYERCLHWSLTFERLKVGDLDGVCYICDNSCVPKKSAIFQNVSLIMWSSLLDTDSEILNACMNKSQWGFYSTSSRSTMSFKGGHPRDTPRKLPPSMFMV